MATNISVSNVSPMLTYIPRTLWFEGTPENDTELSSYTYQSYHATNASQGQASVSFSWYGTVISVYGGYRERLGPYDVVLDGEVTSFPGFISGPEQVPAILFSRSGLQPHVHQIQIINTSQDPTRPVLDFDHLLAETPADEARIVDDKAPGCSWLPSGNQTWGSDTQSHWTNDSVASVELNFTGHGISVFGVVAAANGAFSVSIDGRLTHTLYPNTETNPLVNTSQLLFSGLNLGTGNHTILIQNNPLPSSRATLNIDYSQVLSDAPPPPPKPTS
ncbi:hypothetical protein CERSUDRAFT_84818 [Gelatoporia subvermispora B]|uniref:Uncharacterized protein n=1 Tax=Ceriporiopsis subvermispora (strain B) TaxID=914234 RepID=M2QF79_CERS8|nr:hypothetical protein CERSUDRAFT_84818 [Gelatoporia subvermispora B]